jgi:hypothetical protein
MFLFYTLIFQFFLVLDQVFCRLMSATQEPVAEPVATPEVATETPAPEAADATPASNEAPETPSETPADTQAESQPQAEAEAAVKEPAKVVKRKSIFNPFGRRKEEPKKEEPKKEEQAENIPTESAPEAPTPTKSADEPTVTKRKSKGFNFFTRKVNVELPCTYSDLIK